MSPATSTKTSTGNASKSASFSARRFLAPAGLSAALLAAAPFLGQLRDALLELFPSYGIRLLGAAFVVAAGLAVVAAVTHIRDRRLLRYGGLATSLAVATVLLAGWGTGQAQVDAVERLHVLAYGLLSGLLYGACRPIGDARAWIYPLLATALVGTLDEWVQWLVPTRVGDIRDVALNAASGLVGLLFALAVSPPGGEVRRLGRTARAPVLRATAALLLVVAAFFDCAHLGHWVEEPGLGRFRSWHTREDLVAAAQERRARWLRDGLPGKPRPLSREDYFVTEVGWHVAHRNASLERSDWRSAHLENLILETFFDPALDLRGHHSGNVHRLSAADRERLARAARDAGVDEWIARGSYESPVLAHRVVAGLAPRVYWVAVLALVVGLALLGSARGRGRGRPADRVPTGDSAP